MTSTSKLTITLSPEEVRLAVEIYVLQHRVPQLPFCGPMRIEMKVGRGLVDTHPSFDGATVEVTTP